MTARLPDDEVERLVSLYEHCILDSAPTQEFDDLVRLAAHVCGVPIAAVTLIDAHRQWFKAIFGLDLRETPRGIAFCAHTILEPDILVVQDTQTDPRFADNPMVTGDPNVRFYAGVPLITEQGHTLGTLCIIDTVPHALAPAQQETLRLLGRQATGHLRAARRVAVQQSAVVESERTLLERESSERDRLRLAAIVESADEGIIAATLDGTIVFWNQGAERLYGYSAGELIGQHMSVLALASEKHLGREIAARLVGGEELETIEVVRTRKDGTRIDVSLSFSPIRDAVSEVVGVSCLSRDITDRKRTEAALAESSLRLQESETSLCRLSDAAFEGIAVSQDGVLVDVNTAFAAQLGYDGPAEMLGLAPWELVAPECRALVRQKIANCDEQPYEATLRRRDGSTFIAELRGRLTEHGGRPARVTAIRDITAHKEAELALRRSEASLRAVLESAPIILYTTDAVGTVTLSEGTGLVALGLKSGQAVGRSVFEFSADNPDNTAQTQRALAGEAVSFDIRYGERYLHTEIRPLCGADGSSSGLICVCFDVTERAQSEAFLAVSRQRLALATEAARIGIWDWDVVANRLIWDDRMYQIFGVREQDFGGAYDAWRSTLHPDDLDRAEAEIRSVLEGAGDFHCEFRVVWPNGEVRHIEAHASVQRDADGSVLRMTGVNWDVTARRQAEQERRRSEERFRVLFEQSSNAHLLLDEDGIIDCNPATVAMFGCADKSQMLSLHPAVLSPEFQPDGRLSKEKRVEMDALAVSNGFQRFDWVLQKLDGEQFPVEVTLTPVLLEGRTVVLSVLHDLTERKWAEEALRAEQEKFQSLVDGLGTGLLMTDLNDNILYANPRMAEITGFAREELVDQCALQLLLPLEEQERMHRNNRERASGVSGSYEIMFQRKDGSLGWLEVAAVPFRNAAGEVVGTVATNTDITDRVRAEAALRESEARLRLALESGGLGSYDMDQVTLKFLELSETYKAQFGLPPDAEMTPDAVFAMFHPDDVLHMTETVDRANAEGCGWQAEHRVVWPDGSIHWCKAHGLPLFDDAGRPARMIGVTQDITERKALEAERERLAERERTIATRLQAALQPPPEPVPGLQVGSLTQPALDEAQVGGDFYDVFSLGGEQDALVIGDVSGKGLAAAVQLALIRNSLRTTLYLCPRPAEAATQLNTIVTAHNLLVGFVTSWIGVYDAATGRITYASCAHEPGLVRRSDGTVEVLETTGPPLGMDEDAVYTELTVTLAVGDHLLHTDNLPESGPSRREMLGTDGMIRLLAGLPDGPDPQTLAADLVAQAAANAHGVFRDDVTVLLARRE